MNEQAEMFNRMSLKDRLELLFYMQLHSNATIQTVHAKVDPEGAEIQPMPDPEKPN